MRTAFGRRLRRHLTATLLLVVLVAVAGLGYGVQRATERAGAGTSRAALSAHTATHGVTPEPDRVAELAARRTQAHGTGAGFALPQRVHRMPVLEYHPELVPGKRLLGAGDRGDDVRDLQARLKQLHWYADPVEPTFGSATVAAVRGFQAKRAIAVTGYLDPRTRDRLHAMTREPTDDELHNRLPKPRPAAKAAPGGSVVPVDARCRTGRVLCIDKTSRTLRWMVDGKVLRTLDVRFGSTLNNTPTREGAFRVYSKSRDHVSHLYGSSMPFAMFFSGGQAVHYSSDFAARGYAGASHGCVNVRDYSGIAWLYDQVRLGDAVVVYWS